MPAHTTEASPCTLNPGPLHFEAEHSGHVAAMSFKTGRSRMSQHRTKIVLSEVELLQAAMFGTLEELGQRNTCEAQSD